jgi:hypothetical protein
MNAIAQVRHLLVHDLRRQRLSLAMYAATVALTTVAALTFAMRSTSWLDATPWGALGGGLVLLASAVQADSPYRPDAFWVSRPIQPAALLGAKLVLALLIVALPVAALTGTLTHIGFPSSEYGAAVGKASLDYASWLLLGMAIAAVTRDLRSFINVCVGLVVVFFFGLAALGRRTGTNFGSNETATLVAAALLYMGPLAVLGLVYLKRDAVRMARAVGGVLLGLWLVVLPFSISQGYPVVRKATATLPPNEAPQVALVHDVAVPGDEPGTLRFHVSGKPWRDAARLVVSVDSFLVHARDGATVTVPRVRALVVQLRDPMPVGVSFHETYIDSSFKLPLYPAELARLTSGIESLELIGTVEPFTARVRAIVPFTSETRVQQGGTFFRVDSVQRDPAVSTAVTTTVSVRTERETPITETSAVLPWQILIDDSAHRAIRLFTTSLGTSSGGMIVPGMSILRRWAKVEARWPVAEAGSAMAPARLMWLDWTSLGQAQLRLRAERE